MSQDQGSMDPQLRSAMLLEVRDLLPAFLGAASIEREGAINAAVELLGLPDSDLRRVMAVHILLASPIRDFVSSLPSGVRRPVASSVRSRVAGRNVNSGIDWAATARHRATSSPMGDIWVTRPANRVFDIPENQALAWLLDNLETRGALAGNTVGVGSGAWIEDVHNITNSIRRAKRVAWVESVSPIWPGDGVYSRLQADRVGFYRLRVTAAARYLRRVMIDPSADDIVDALGQRYFEPSQDWKLFEIAVLIRISRALERVGERLNPTQLFAGARARPFAVYRISATRVVRVWYQSWPPSSSPSELADAIQHYGLPPGGNRPDIVVELVEGGQSEQAIVLELKASSSGSYLSSGFSQLLGYLRDRPRLLTGAASGWLVAPPSRSFVSKPAGARALWVVSSSEVGEAISAFARSGIRSAFST